MSDDLLGIGELAERTGLSVKLIRHWSDIGVVPPAARTAAGYRRYAPEAVARLELARTLRELGLSMAVIREVVTQERDLAEVAAFHADALEARIHALRMRQAVLRSFARRKSTTKDLTEMTGLARLSPEERDTIVHDFMTDALGDLDPSAYRDGLLLAVPDLPPDPTAGQVEAWIELAALIRDPELRAAIRRMGEYAAEHAAREHREEDVLKAQELTDLWVASVDAAMTAGIAADSPAAEPVVAGIVAAWLPAQAGTGFAPADEGHGDGPEARRRLLEQLEVASDTRLERYWQLLCLINGWPVRPSIAGEGEWLMTALRANPEPGARAARIGEILSEEADVAPEARLEACARVLAEVEELVTAVPSERLGDPTPCTGWDVRALLDHLVWENLLWTGLAEGTLRSDFAADHLGEDHVAAFRTAARATLAAFRRPGMLRSQYGPAPGWRLVEQVTIEMLVHGWDLARAIGRPTDLAPDVAEAIMPAVREIYGDLPRTPGGSFGPAQPVPGSATAVDRLAAYLGRAVG
ncbi:TIGR03086 family metal-binding protein [Microtetraspora niveoalba]|uniref:TIGR03086 family metal-binding protein n=1 Tax=Microtetraspora niveoalba TaxID=46175 RepID=UPI001C3F4A7B|nr:TIGR03086 family metal-binding protein [Microtetraspora niveoalba]